MPDPRIWPIKKSVDWSQLVPFASGIIVEANTKRADLDITNVSDYWVYLSRSDPAEELAGIPLAPNGGTYHIGTNNMWEGSIWALSANKQEESWVAISEGYRPR